MSRPGTSLPSRLAVVLTASLVSGLLPAVAAAPLLVTSLFPVGGQRGGNVEVIATGTFASWPVQGWGSKGLTVTPGKDRGRFTIAIAANAPPGVGWLRLHDSAGGGNLRPFVVGTLPELIEKEPNETVATAQLLSSSALVINGRLQKANDVDCFAVPLRKGQTLVASLDASRSPRAPMDAVLQLLSPDGFVLAQNNDTHGLDPQLVHAVNRDGVHVVRLFTFPAQPDASIRLSGGENYLYRLTLTTDGFAEQAWPAAVQRGQPIRPGLLGWNLPAAAKALDLPAPDADDDRFATLFHPGVAGTGRVRFESHPVVDLTDPSRPDATMPLATPLTVCGRLSEGSVQRMRIRARQGQALLLQAEARSLGYALDPTLRVLDAAGKVLARAEPTAPNRDVELTFTPSREDVYTVELRDLHGGRGERHRYRLRIAPPVADFDLTVALDRFQVVPGKPLTVPVQVQRRGGFKGEIRLKAEGLPPGITARVEPAGAGATIPVVLTADRIGPAGAFRLVGDSPALPGARRLARATLADLKADGAPPGLVNDSTANLWVTATAVAGPPPAPLKKKKR